MEFINLDKQYKAYKTEIDKAIQNVLNHGNYIMGSEVLTLEEKLAEYVGVKHCISVASGTDSLEIALRALGLGANDEVITVPFSWISSSEVIAQVGAKPVFVDIDRSSYTLDPDLLESAITDKTKAIIPVSLFGQMPNLEKIIEIAIKYGIPVIEDGAQSFGATRNGKRSCGASLIGSTSFFPAKPLGCYGDGGALFTDDEELANKMRAIRSHGGLVRHYHTLVGMNGRFDTLQAAIILAKWPNFEDEVKTRNEYGELYSQALNDVVITPKLLAGNTHVYGQYTIRIDSDLREGLRQYLKLKDIPTGIYYPKCFHEQPVFDYLEYKIGDFPESEKASREVLSLPMSPFLEKTELYKVTSAITEFFENNIK